MQITEMLGQMGGVRSMANELGVNETEVASGAEALAPAILGGFKKQVQSQPSGLEGLGGLLGKLGGGGLLDDVLSPHPTNLNRGNDVLGQIFGSKDVSRAVAQNAASKTGLSPDLLKRMLPMMAMLVAGYIAKQKSAGAAPTAQQAPTPAPAAPTGGGLGGRTGRIARKGRSRRARERRHGRYRVDARHEWRRQCVGRHPANGRQNHHALAKRPFTPPQSHLR
jgi:hypothetical protein